MRGRRKGEWEVNYFLGVDGVMHPRWSRTKAYWDRKNREGEQQK